MKVLITGFFAVIYMSNANAAEFCATTTADLHQHLSTAENNGEADTIKLRAGNFDGESQHFKFYSLDNENLTIIGGWTEFFGNPCGQRTENHAFGSSFGWKPSRPGDAIIYG